MIRPWPILVVATAWLVLYPVPAEACPVCGLAGTQDNWREYALMSIMLSALPLGMVIAGIVAMRRVTKSALTRVEREPHR